MKRLIVAVLALACAACGGGSAPVGPSASPAAVAPLERTAVDEKAVVLAARAVDAAALSATALVRTGVIKPGSPVALALAERLDQARDAVKAAELARQAGSAKDYGTALVKAGAALDAVKALVAKVGS